MKEIEELMLAIKNTFFKTIALALAGLLVFESSSAYALEALHPVNVQAPSMDFILGTMCNGLLPQGLTIDPSQPFQFNLLVHDPAGYLGEEALREESQKLVKYFLASVAIPGKELWVNLGPNDRDRILTPAFATTDMGKDLLIQDYWLKTLSTQATNPESETGRIFWDELYEKIYAAYGSIDIPVESFQRVWIVPESADVVVNDRSAYITGAHLKVMLESDYQKTVSLRATAGSEAIPDKINSDEIASSQRALLAMTEETNDVNEIYTTVMRDTVIPYLEQRVNEGEEFVNLRQIYRALILAVWFKNQLKNSLFNQLYADQGRVDGIALNSDGWKEQVFDKYLENFKSGVYSVIKESYDPERQDLITRSYFSGGVNYMETRSAVHFHEASTGMSALLPARGSVHSVATQVVTDNFAMMSSPGMKKFLLGMFVALAFMFISQSVSAAEYSRNSDGNLVVKIEQGDQLGKIALDVKHAAGMDGNVWDKGGAYDLVLENMTGDQNLKPGNILVINTNGNEELGSSAGILAPQNFDTDSGVPFGTPLLPQRYADSGADETGADQQNDLNQNDMSSSTSADARWGKAMESVLPQIDATVAVKTSQDWKAPSSRAIWNFLLILALSAVLIFGFKRALSGKRPTSSGKTVVHSTEELVMNSDDPLSGVAIASPAAQNFTSIVQTLPTAATVPVRYVLVLEEDPLKNVVIAAAPVQNFSEVVHALPESVFEVPTTKEAPAVLSAMNGWNIPVIDPLDGIAVARPPAQSMQKVLLNLILPDDNLPVEFDLVPQSVLATRAHPQSLLKIDRMLAVVGVLSALAYFGSNIYMIGAGGLLFPLMNRIFFTARLWTHERMHLWDAVRRGVRGVDTAANRRANMTSAEWLQLLMPFNRSQKILEPKIELGFVDALTQKRLRLFGFQYSLFESIGTIGIFAIALALSPGFLLSGVTVALISSALIILRESYETDILGRTCDGQLGCGNFGFFWKPSEQEGSAGFRSLFPQWAQQAADDIVRQLSTRGGQSQGMTIFYKSRSGASTLTGKYVKGKRWSPTLSRGTINKLRHDVRLAMLKAVGKMNLRWFGVMGLSGHVRFTTSSRVTAPASHPHAYREKRLTWLPMKKGDRIVMGRDDGDMVVSITHNGDNDGIYMFSNPQIENERGEYLDFDKAKAFFMKMLGVTKISTGDSPLVALQMGFLMTKGSWAASARVGQILGTYDSLAEAEESPLRPEDWDVVGNVFDRVFEGLMRQSPELERDFTDMFDVTKEIPAASLARLKKEFLEAIAREIKSRSAAGQLMAGWNQNRMDEFVNLMLESFFRFDRYRAVQEFQKIADGSYGLVVRSSLGGDTGITMLSLDQPLVYGFNKKRDLFAYASDHTSLLGEFGPHGALQDLVLLKPGGRGQIADLFFDPAADLKLTTRVYDSSEKRELQDWEIRNQSYPLRKDSRYYAPLIEYKDSNNKVQEDLERMPAELQKLMDTWKDADSFNRRTAEALFRKLLEKYLMAMGRSESEAYVKLRYRLLREIRAELRQILPQTSFTSSGVQEMFVRQMAERIAHETVLGEYAFSQLDVLVAKWSRKLASEAQANPALIKEKLFSQIESLDGVLGSKTKNLIPEIGGVIKGLLGEFLQGQQPLNGSVISVVNSQDWMSRMIAALNDPKVPFKPLPRNTVDVVISGYSDSDSIDQNLAEILQRTFPDLKIVSINSNDLLRNQDMVGPETLVILTSKSGGQTFATGAVVGILEKITPGNIFGSVGRPDSLMSVALGQKLLPNEQPIDRMFVTGNTYPAESNTVSEVLMYGQQLKMVEYLADRMNQTFVVLKPFGMTLNRNNIEFFKQQNSALVEQTEMLAGVKVDGTKFESAESASIRTMAKRLSRKVWEPLFALIVSVAYIGYSVALAPLGLPTVATIITWLASLSGFGSIAVVSLVSALHAVFYIGLAWMATVGYRMWYGLPLWSRLGAQPTTISEKGYFALMHELLLSKLGSQSWPWMTMSVYSGDGRSEVPAKFAHRIQRSGTLFSAMPAYDSRSAFKTTLAQAKNITNYMWGGLRQWFPDFLLGGPEVITLGKGDFNNPNANHFHITTGEVPAKVAAIIEKLDNKRDVTPEEMNQLAVYTFTGDEFARFVAFKQLFGYAYLPFKKLWNIEESFPRIGVHSTRASEVPNHPNGLSPVDYFSGLKKKVVELESVSHAMLNENIAPGGIDLNPEKWMLKETNLTNPTTEDRAMLQEFKTMPRMFIPVIIGIQPIKTEAQLSALTGFGSTLASAAGN